MALPVLPNLTNQSNAKADAGLSGLSIGTGPFVVGGAGSSQRASGTPDNLNAALEAPLGPNLGTIALIAVSVFSLLMMIAGGKK